jgi:hypothetical protein
VQNQGKDYIKGFTSGVPAGKLLILDMEAEEEEIWKLTDSFYNASFVWAAMNNFGGNNGLYGDMPLVYSRTEVVLPPPSSRFNSGMFVMSVCMFVMCVCVLLHIFGHSFPSYALRFLRTARARVYVCVRVSFAHFL